MNENIYIQLSRYTQPILIILGTIGAVINQILFHRRKLIKKASCTIYLRALSINDLLALYLIVLTQWLNDQFHWSPANKYIWYCKIQMYATFTFYTLSPYYIVLVCIDRFCRASKCSLLHKIATPHKAHRIIMITIITVALVYIHIPFQYSLRNSKCIPENFAYYHFLGYLILVFYSLSPPLLMSIFSSWTLILLSCHQKRHKRIYQTRIILSNQRRYHRNYQVMKILFLYVTTTIICTLPFSVLILLDTHRYHSRRQLLLYIKISVLLCNVNHCTSFYIYTLGTPLYRRELVHLYQSFRRSILLWLN